MLKCDIACSTTPVLQAIDYGGDIAFRRQNFCEWKQPESLEPVVQNERLLECLGDLRPGEETSATSDCVKAVIRKALPQRIVSAPLLRRCHSLGKSEDL